MPEAAMSAAASGSGGQAAAAGGPGAAYASASLIHKMSKKIAQLAKVVHLLNTKADEHAYTMQCLEASHEADIEAVTREANSKLLIVKKRLEAIEADAKDKSAAGGSAEGEHARALQLLLDTQKDRHAAEKAETLAKVDRANREHAEAEKTWKQQSERLLSGLRKEVDDVRASFAARAKLFDAALAAAEKNHAQAVAAMEGRFAEEAKRAQVQQEERHKREMDKVRLESGGKGDELLLATMELAELKEKEKKWGEESRRLTEETARLKLLAGRLDAENKVLLAQVDAGKGAGEEAERLGAHWRGKVADMEKAHAQALSALKAAHTTEATQMGQEIQSLKLQVRSLGRYRWQYASFCQCLICIAVVSALYPL